MNTPLTKQLCVIPSCSNDRLEDSDYCYWHAQEFPEPPSARLEVLPSNEVARLLRQADLKRPEAVMELRRQGASEIDRLCAALGMLRGHLVDHLPPNRPWKGPADTAVEYIDVVLGGSAPETPKPSNEQIGMDLTASGEAEQGLDAWIHDREVVSVQAAWHGGVAWARAHTTEATDNERLRAALEVISNQTNSTAEVSTLATTARRALSGDSSAPETTARPTYIAIAIVRNGAIESIASSPLPEGLELWVPVDPLPPLGDSQRAVSSTQETSEEWRIAGRHAYPTDTGVAEKASEHPPCSITNMWQCGSCRTFNPLLLLACQSCATPRDAQNGRTDE